MRQKDTEPAAAAAVAISTSPPQTRLWHAGLRPLTPGACVQGQAMSLLAASHSKAQQHSTGDAKCADMCQMEKGEMRLLVHGPTRILLILCGSEASIVGRNMQLNQCLSSPANVAIARCWRMYE